MDLFARIAVNIPSIAGVFDYALPPEWEGQVNAGHLVTVPFRNMIVQGVILQLVSQPSVTEVKTALDLLDLQPVLTPAQIALAHWLAQATLSPLAACIGLMIPVGLNQQADVVYALNGSQAQSAGGNSLSPLQRSLLDLLSQRGPLRGRQIDRHVTRVDWRRSVASLVRQGLVSSHSVLPPVSVRPKFIRTVQLAVSPEKAEAAMPALGNKLSRDRRQAALRFLIRQPGDVNVAWVYAESGCSLADLQVLAEKELVVFHETEFWRDPLDHPAPDSFAPAVPPVLNLSQQSALDSILEGFQAGGGKFLLHGVTGSGKTEIYIRAAEEAVRRGCQALILVPEIALTPQTVQRFLRRFPGEVGLLHSRLSEGERYDTWRRARLGLLKVIIGPRSALFAPLPHIGFIAVDECHDSSYYQSDPPFYNAVTAAVEYAGLCGAVCVLGSATPPLDLRFQALPQAKGPSRGGTALALLELPARIERRSFPAVQVVDMREELKSGGRGIFSRPLLDSLEQVLKKDQQAILFLNRRGTATYVFCRDCGHTLKCPRCETPLTLHTEGSVNISRLTCHHCGYVRQLPKTCPNCGQAHIGAYGLGSEKVESELQALFPSARILRWDRETTRQKDSHEIILGHFSAHRADVLVGTQMLAKGMDLPLVTLVGIVLADVGLNLPDPFADERTFDVLTQVAGRAGRSSLGGRVVLQTFHPEHFVIQAAAGHDYAAFYARELENRKRLRYPPFTRLVRLEYRHLDAARAEAEAVRLGGVLSSAIKFQQRIETDLIGPVPCFYARQNGFYRWQIIVRGPDPLGLLRSLPLSDWRVEVDPVTLL
jgi:primosomal protein N' (replication factor Y) (superfamily II helicase)